METAEILADSTLMQTLRASIKQAKTGQTIDFDQLNKTL